jgi:CHAT domain-containing protein/tetratricopeptide (TPR) repeat protein
LGNAHKVIGESQKALDHLERSLSIWERLNHLQRKISVLNEFGRVYQEIGDFRKAGEYHFAAKRLEPPRTLSQQWELLHEATVNEQLGDTAKANDQRRRAIVLIEADPSTLTDVRALQALTRAYFHLGERSRALEIWERQAKLKFGPSDLNGEDYVLGELGSILIAFKEYRKAIEYLERALIVNQTTGIAQRRIYLTERLGDAHIAIGEPGQALKYYQELTRNGRITDRRREIRVRYGIARALRDIGDYENALKHAEDLITATEENRANILGLELRRSFAASAHQYYQFYIDLLMLLAQKDGPRGYTSKAIQVAETLRARSLLETIAEGRSDIRQGVDPELVKREKAAQIRLNFAAERHARLLTTKHTPEQESEARARLEAAKTEFDEVSRQIRITSPRYAALTQPKPISAVEIQRDLLDADTLLLEYSLGDDRSYFWSVTKTELRGFQIPKRPEIETVATKIKELLQNDKHLTAEGKPSVEYTEATVELSDMILRPVAEQIKGKRLVIVADGALQYIPFSALPMPKRTRMGGGANDKFVPLAVTNEIVSLPSVSVLSVLRKEAAGRKRAQKGVAIVADPVFSETDERLDSAKAEAVVKGAKTVETGKPDTGRMALERAFSFSFESGKPFSIPRLPFTREEAKSIFLSSPKSTSFIALDFEASKDAVLGRDLSKYRVVHFATHGILHSEHPELSGIVLSLVDEKGEPVNGFLRLNEIYNMKLNADLVVLSACQTALGKEVRGEGLIGLTRGFMYAGTPRVVASLWKVDDVATAELMKIFYQKMLKENMRPAAALRAAKIAMMKQKRWSSPYYWAAFELQGDWR